MKLFEFQHCGNPDCHGTDGKWETEALAWSHQTGSPLIYVDEVGLANGMEVMRSKVSTHACAVLLVCMCVLACLPACCA